MPLLYYYITYEIYYNNTKSEIMKLKKLSSCILLSLGLSSYGLANTINGTVKDENGALVTKG